MLYVLLNLTAPCRTIKGLSVSTMIIMIDVSTKPIAIFKRVVKLKSVSDNYSIQTLRQNCA